MMLLRALPRVVHGRCPFFPREGGMTGGKETYNNMSFTAGGYTIYQPIVIYHKISISRMFHRLLAIIWEFAYYLLEQKYCY